MSGNLAKLFTYRAGDTFSYGLAVPVALPTSAWTATVTLSNPSAPNLPGPTPPTASVVAVEPTVGDSTKTDYQIVLTAPPAVTATWPKGNSQLVGVLTLMDGNTPPNVVSTSDFVLRGR